MENKTALLVRFKTSQTQSAGVAVLCNNNTKELTLGTNVSPIAVTFHRTNCWNFDSFWTKKKSLLNIGQFVTLQIAIRTSQKMLIMKLSR